MSRSGYVIFGVIGMAFFAFGAVFEIASDFVVTLIAASILAIPIAIQQINDRRAKNARQRLLRAYAESRSWPFEATGSISPDSKFRNLTMFDRGQSKQTLNTMHCTAQTPSAIVPMLIGDYDYEHPRGKNPKQYKISYLVARLPVNGMPKLTVRCEGAIDRVKSAVGFDDIDFESKAFSDQFHVSSPDKRFAYRLITPQVMEYLMLACPASGPPSFCAGGSWIGIMSTQTRWSLFEIEAARNWMEGLLSVLPDEFVH